jgi:hypothetical protein
MNKGRNHDSPLPELFTKGVLPTMFLSLATLAKYDFNKRRLTETDFYAICEQRSISVLELDVLTSFYIYHPKLDRKTIVLDCKLRGVAREFAMFHELSHALLSSRLNDPQALFMGMCDTKEEYEADAFASIALIPRARLLDTSFVDDCCCGTADEIYEKRLHIYETYGV